VHEVQAFARVKQALLLDEAKDVYPVVLYTQGRGRGSNRGTEPIPG